MRGRRPRTTRLRAWMVGLACALALATVGCNSRRSAPQAGGASGSKAEKARKDAEALALNAVNAGATAQARAVPETAARRDSGGRLAAIRETLQSSIGLVKSGASAPAAPPAAPIAPAAPSAPPAPPPAAPVVVAPPAPKAIPRPGPAVVVRERIVSAVAPTEAGAEEDVIAQARDLIERKLAELDPPVRYKPSSGEVKAEFVRKDSRTVRQPDAEERKRYAEAGLTGSFVYVEYDVEVTADQVRELRSQERASAGLRVLGMLVAAALAGFLFLRADEWTKGYLTSWLALAAVALAGGAAAAFIFI